MNTDMTLSFAHGKGDMDHNARRKNGNPRTWGQRKFKAWNDIIMELDVDDVLEQKFGDALRKYNEKQIANRHPERTKTMEAWVNAQRRGNRPYTEYVIQLGNRLTGCPYEYVTNERGEMIARDGSVIMPWQTKKILKPILRDGKYYTPSQMQKRLKKYYRAAVKKFQEINNNMVVVGAYIHCDEKSGCHLHLDTICLCRTKNGIGLGMGVTGCIEQMLTAKGITYGKTRKDNAQKIWTKMMRDELAALAAEHDFHIVDGHCAGRKHKTTEQYIVDENIRNDILDKKHAALLKKEAELNRWEESLQMKQDDLQDLSDELLTRKKKQESELSKREAAVTQQEAILAGREIRLDAREVEVKGLVQVVETKAFIAKTEAETIQHELDVKERMLAAREVEVNKKQYIIDKVEKEYPNWLEQTVADFNRSRCRNRGGR